MPCARPQLPQLSPPPVLIERARPLLGTWVRIGIGGMAARSAHAVIESAFAAIARIHELMSFHEPGSELSRLNREASCAPVEVDPHTFEVLRQALGIAAASGGRFDPSIAPQLVEWGRLPRPCGAPAADPRACWRDIELLEPDRIRFHRPLWVDLGGIAKGYAVDAALAAIAPDRSIDCRINAGGDLRVAGPGTERVLLRVPGHAPATLPVVELRDGSLASSTPLPGACCDAASPNAAPSDTVTCGPHVDALGRTAVPSGRFVTVIAPECTVADALTKVVLADGAGSDALLRRYGASGWLHEPGQGWRALGAVR